MKDHYLQLYMLYSTTSYANSNLHSIVIYSRTLEQKQFKICNENRTYKYELTGSWNEIFKISIHMYSQFELILPYVWE